VIGEPLAARRHWHAITAAFVATFPDAHFFHVHADYAALLSRLGYFVNDVGCETTLQVRSVCVCVFVCVVCVRVCVCVFLGVSGACCEGVRGQGPCVGEGCGGVSSACVGCGFTERLATAQAGVAPAPMPVHPPTT
jgi:hypothetical protein